MIDLQIDCEIHIAIPSYRRAGKVTTHLLFPDAWIWVPESQEDSYKAHYDRVISIPDDLDGNIARKRNAILTRSPCPYVLMADDDVKRIGVYEGGAHRWLDQGDLRWLVVHGFSLALQLGISLWGIQNTADPKNYTSYSPLSFLSPVYQIRGFLDLTLMHDESVLDQDDVDIWLQHIARHRHVLRLNKYHLDSDWRENPGGIPSYRTKEYTLTAIRRMQNKWGYNLYQMRKGQLDNYPNPRFVTIPGAR